MAAGRDKRNIIPVVPSAGPGGAGGGASAWGGWVRPLPDLIDQLRADVEGLQLRVKDPVGPGVPAAYQGVKVFLPETAEFNVDTLQTHVGTNPCNFVVRDGTTYEIPIVFPGPGVFIARYLKVSIYQRLFVPAYNGPVFLPVMTNTQAFVVAHTSWTTKFSVPPVQPFQATGKKPLGAINYFWNIIDTKSGRKLADDLVSHMMLLPRTYMPLDDGGASPSILEIASLPDGDLLELDAPWVFERDGQVAFLFRPITPMLQFASSISGNTAGYGFDDRENSVRNQSVTVTAELHGYRYETDQDAIRAGVLTREQDGVQGVFGDGRKERK